MKHSFRNKTGQFARRPVPGRLYEFRGTIVRLKAIKGSEATVSYHKALTGKVNVAELRAVSKADVETYLRT